MLAQRFEGAEVFVAMIAARLMLVVVRLVEMVGQDVWPTKVFETPVTRVSANLTPPLQLP